MVDVDVGNVPSKKFDFAAYSDPSQRDVGVVDYADVRVHAGDTVVWPVDFDDPSSHQVSCVSLEDAHLPGTRNDSLMVGYREVRKFSSGFEHPREVDLRGSDDRLDSISPRGDCPDSS